MNKELKQRIINFLSDCEFHEQYTEEATAIYNLLTRKPGRQVGYRKDFQKKSYFELDNPS